MCMMKEKEHSEIWMGIYLLVPQTHTKIQTHIYICIYICIYKEMLTTDYMKNISNTYT